MRTKDDDLLQHILGRVVQPLPDCMIWPDAVDRGYGRVYVDGTAQRVHRVTWELVNGPIPDGLTVDHLCRVRYCCNTEHMELVTQAENVRRAVRHRPSPARPRLVVGSMCGPGRHRIDSQDDIYVAPDGGRCCVHCQREGYARRNEQRRKRRTSA